jgi:hypothetical protein
MTVGHEDDDERLRMRAEAYADGVLRGELPHIGVRAAIASAFFVGYRSGALDAVEPRLRQGLNSSGKRRK